DAWEVCEAPPAEDTAALLASLRSRFPAAAAELSLAGRCGERLAEVLHGTENPLQVLFPDGSFAALERVYRDSPFARQANALAAEAVAEAAAALPAGRPLRLVELGAGTGGLTAHVLPKLPDDAEYHFTDVSHLFLASAREKFREFPGVRCGILDLERSPAEQGYAPHSFDVVLAANVFHATADLRRSLRHARELLAPNGLLVLIEGTGRRRLLDLVFGLTEGWWKFADTDLRPDYPLISARRWLDLLRAEGFTGAEVRPALGDGPEPDQVTVIARGPATANGVRPAVNGHRKTEAAAPAEAKKLAPSADRPSRKALLAANPSERRAMLTRYFRTQLGQVLGMAADDVDVDAPVNGLGLDSLMAIQLRNRVEEELSLTVPLVAFLQGLSVAQLVEKAAEQLAEAEEAPAADAEPPSVETLLARVEGMSEDEVNAALRALTTREGRPRRPVGKNGH
ncbi:MAG TPA: methyltransferase, partial [Gemmataceae bacterium]|nr:methyltransferase [Gemmataceae bacterium]